MIKKILFAIMIALPMCAIAQTKIGVISADSVFQVIQRTGFPVLFSFSSRHPFSAMHQFLHRMHDMLDYAHTFC